MNSLPGPEGSAGAHELLEAALRDPDVRSAQQAVDQLATAPLGPGEIELLGKAVTDRDPDVRRRCVHLLARFPQASVIPLIVRALDDPLWTVREAAALALRHLAAIENDPVAIHELLIARALHDKSPFVRDAAIQSLKQLEDRTDAAIDALRQALTDRRPPVRCRAAAALSCFAQHAGAFLPDLLHAINDPHRRVRRAALVAIPSLGARATAAVPQLVTRCCERDANVRLAARQSLAQVLAAAPSQLQSSLAALQDGSFDAETVLGELLVAEPQSSAAAQEFLQICRRRLAWRRELKREALPPERESEATWKAVAAAADDASRDAECGWLLARFLELKLPEME